MEKILINGGNVLKGTVKVNGMKNAALPIIFASVLVKGKCVIENLPNVSDVKFSLEILREMGASITPLRYDTVEIDCTNVKAGTSPFEKVRKMRASYYLLGAEFGRFGYSKVGLPGGCDFGARPIDQHIKGFEALGGDVTTDDEYVEIKKAHDTIKGTNIFFDMVTVGGTANIMIASVLAEGTTVIDNAAREPHIVDLANFLNTCGARISGAGTDMIKIRGVKELHGCTYAIIPDMIEAGTYMISAAATGGRILVENVIPKHLESVTAKLTDMGVNVEEFDDSVLVDATGAKLKATGIKTQPYPGFPTDMHPQMTVLLCISQGSGFVLEGVYETRFRYVEELEKMGAKIKVEGRRASITGGTELTGASVKALDLRAGVAMVIAGLAANGTTEISDVFRIERGYEDIVGKLTALGADIRKMTVPETVQTTAN